MTRANLCRAGRLSVVTMVLSVLLAAVGCGAVSESSATTVAAVPDWVPTPLATSLQSATGTWVTLPMGHLDQPADTFWQLFFRSAGGSSWTNKVGATATATNGGLIMATALGQPFVTAVRPTNLLRFSPVIATTAGGGSWANGVVPEGLAASPDSLSVAPDGHAVALVKSGLDAQVLANDGDLSSWQVVTTARRLATTTAGTTCAVQSLSAVLAGPTTSYVGARCARPGTIGIFAGSARGWKLDQPDLPTRLRRGRVEVLRLQETSSGLSALLGVITAHGEAFLAASQSAVGGGSWSISPVLTWPAPQRLVSFGPATGSGFFVLGTSSSGAMRLAVSAGSTAGWSLLPAPPRFTDTVAFNPADAASVEALAASGETMTVWSLDPGPGTSVRGQVLHVALTYGSSS